MVGTKIDGLEVAKNIKREVVYVVEKLKTQNIYNDVFAEVEKVEYKLKKLI